MWYVYMLRCADDTLYTGITTDIARRVEEHNTSPRAAKYTRVRRPVTLAYSEKCSDRSTAAKREWELKQLSKHEKEALCGSGHGAQKRNR